MSYRMPFEVPTAHERVAAIGLNSKTSKGQLLGAKYKELYTGASGSLSVGQPLLKALQPDDAMFQPIPVPGRHDWLTDHREDGQTFHQFVKGNMRSPDSKRSKIYFLPVSFSANDKLPADILDLFVKFASSFFCMKVSVLRQADCLAGKIGQRVNSYTKKLQVDAGQALRHASKLLPGDAFCVAMVTMTDLYPCDDWNFVFGLASAHQRVGIYSLARYMPGFFDDEGSSMTESPEQLKVSERVTLLKRTCLLMCHEISHMFGLSHCIYYHCLMNGSNNFEESDAKPLRMCPVCLRKLQFVCKFDVVPRYEALASFCHDNGMTHEANWFSTRLEQIRR